MRGGAEDRDVKTVARFRVTGPDTATDVGGTTRVHTRLRRMGAACSEFDHVTTARRFHHARGLGGDERLKTDCGEKIRLGNLSFDDGCANGQDWFAGEERSALTHREQVAGEAE